MSEQRLINANALMGTIRANDYGLLTKHNSAGRGMFTDGIQQAVDEAPTIDPVKHGKWVCRDNGWKCSLCDHSMPYWPMASKQEATPYCPNCGARMDGEV